MSINQPYRTTFFKISAACCCMLLCCISLSVKAQQEALSALNKQFEAHEASTLQEKLFVHTDRTLYLTGETMWMKIYCVDASSHVPLSVSRVAYLEILDRENRAVYQSKVELNAGSGQGTVFISTAMATGNYTLRAYTRWMQNFSPQLYFHQTITVINPFVIPSVGTTQAKPAIAFQMFAEGGHLVAGLDNTIAFKATDKNGVGIDFTGSIINTKNDTVARFTPLKFGHGRLTFTPEDVQSYRVVIRTKVYGTSLHPFPNVEKEGWIIHADDSDPKQLKIRVRSKFSKGSTGQPHVYLLAHAGRKVSSTQVHFLEQGEALFSINKQSLGDGINHLTLFNADKVPMCERLYFKRPSHQAQLKISETKKEYGQRQPVDVALLATEPDGQPAAGDFSVAVFRNDSLPQLPATDIATHMWLTSELKGEIESPDYYLNEATDPVAADNLMLTQGWSRFSWADVLNPSVEKNRLVPEINGHIIEGKVIEQKTGTPASNIITYLSSPSKAVRMYVSRSDDEGRVRFEMKDFTGQRKLIVQNNYALDSTYRVELMNPFAEQFTSRKIADLELLPSLRKPLEARNLRMQLQRAYYEDTPNRIVQPAIDSLPFYGKPDETYRLDDFTRFPTMEEVMREYVPGVLVRKRKGSFHFLTLDTKNKGVFRDDPMVLLDGVPIFSVEKIMQFDPRKVKRLDVMTQQYFLGPVSFSGLASYATYAGDLGDFQIDPRALMMRYEGLQWKREFYSPLYNTETSRKNKVPDMRSLLYWSASIRTHGDGKRNMTFYTGDVSGIYTMVVQGITASGNPVYKSISFQVNEDSEF